MAIRYWLAKSEPSTYPWDELVKDKRTRWDGVRNFEARNNLRAMKQGDAVFFYHSSVGKEIVGLAKVVKEAYPDPTAEDADWSAVDLAPSRALTQPVTLATIKNDKALADIALLRRPRLSVVPISDAEYRRILELGGTKP